MAITPLFVNQVQERIDILSPLRQKKLRQYIVPTLVCVSATKTEARDNAPMLQIAQTPVETLLHEERVIHSARAFIDAECNLFRMLTGHDPLSETGQRILNDDTILAHNYGRVIMGHPTLPELDHSTIYMQVAMGVDEEAY